MQSLKYQRLLRVLLFLAGFALTLEGCRRDAASSADTSTAQVQGPAAPAHAAVR